LKYKKTRDVALIKMELRREHAEKGLVRERLKRQFGLDAPTLSTSTARADEQEIVDNSDWETESESDPDNGSASHAAPIENPTTYAPIQHDHTPTFNDIVNDLHQELDNDEDIPDAPPESSPEVPRIRIFFGQPRLLALSSMFNWSREVGWDEFWFSGVKNYREQLSFYELASREQQRRRRDLTVGLEDVVEEEEGIVAAQEVITIDN
jgi:hypothetical protein